MILRKISNKIKDFIDKKEKNKNVLIVDGVRQVGKTTAIRAALSGKTLEINLELNKELRDRLDKTVEFAEFVRLLAVDFQFTPGTGTVLFIDEANESERLGHFVRQMKEDWPDQTTILSGSMLQKLFRDPKVRIPVGRYERLTVGPFNFAEFLQANQKTPSALTKFDLVSSVSEIAKIQAITLQEHQMLLGLLQHYLHCGGVPDITLAYLKEEYDRQAVSAKKMAQYLATLKDDFIKLFSEEYANLFARVMSAVANLQGYPFKKSAVVKNNNRLADNLLSVFEGWHFVQKIEQKNFATTEAISLYPKRYLFDVGLAKNQREMGVPTIDVLATLNAQQREPLGGLIEQLVCLELGEEFPQICGYKENSFEVDFIIKWHGHAIPIECKASLKPNQNQYRSLDLYNKRFANKLGIVISLSPYSTVSRDGHTILHLPVYAIAALPAFLRELIEG